MRDPLFDDVEPCCEPDWSYEKGQYVHAEGCTRGKDVMTTVSELKAMLREEIAEPLDYPRVPGLSEKELAEYNEGYRYACDLVLSEEPGWSDEDWRTANLDCVPQFRVLGHALTQRDKGKNAAYAWILGELKSIESEKAPMRCSCGEFNVPPYMMVPYGASLSINCEVDGVYHRYPQPCYVIKKPDLRVGNFEDGKTTSTITIPRARYNHLLDMEKSVIEFTENFTRWEEA